MRPFGQDEGVKIDVAHAHLVTGLVKANIIGHIQRLNTNII